MRKIALIAAFIVCIVFVSANSSLAGDVWPVGSIIQSLLEEGSFQAEMGTEWVKMDGRPVSKSDEISSHLDGTTDASGNILLPDARGKFLRMLDDRSAAERAVNGDPEDNRLVGGYQADDFKSHSHSYQKGSGSDAHPFGEYRNIHHTYTSGTTELTGGKETRPKNIAVNYFVKVRKCQSSQCK